MHTLSIKNQWINGKILCSWYCTETPSWYYIRSMLRLYLQCTCKCYAIIQNFASHIKHYLHWCLIIFSVFFSFHAEREDEPIIISRKPVEQLNEPAVLRQVCGVLGCIDGDNGSPVIRRQSGEKQAVFKHQRCIGPWCLHRRGEKATIPGKHGEKRCDPFPICFKRKEKDEKPAPKRRCIPPFCTGKPTLNRRCIPPDNSGCIDRKEKDEELADNQDTPVYKPAPKRQCPPSACSG